MVRTETQNISRLDVFVGDRPQLSIDIINNTAQLVLERPRHETPFIEINGLRTITSLQFNELRFEEKSIHGKVRNNIMINGL